LFSGVLNIDAFIRETTATYQGCLMSGVFSWSFHGFSQKMPFGIFHAFRLKKLKVFFAPKNQK